MSRAVLQWGIWCISLMYALAGKGDAKAVATVVVSSPNGNIQATISVDGGRLQYTLTRDGLTVLEPSSLGVTVNGTDLGAGVMEIAASASVEVIGSYPWHGAKSLAVNHYSQTTLTVSRASSDDIEYEMTWRAYDDGVAYRYHIPGAGPRAVTSEMSAWTVPAGTTLWTQLNTSYYEGLFMPLQAGTFWVVVATPVLCKLPVGNGNASGYAAIMEADLRDYSGMSVEPVNGSRTLRAKFISEAQWQVPAGTTTPWRVTLTSATLDGMVNSTILPNLCSEPAPELAGASWIRPGRSVWSWWLNDVTRYEDQVPYMDAARQLGFEYTLWDEKWENWSPANLDYLLQYAKSKDLRVWLWKRWTTLDEPSERDAFFGWIDEKNAGLGEKIVVGVKIDFMNSEFQSTITWYETVLQHAAEHELMLNFHGANKPSGLSRTYPNEMTREGVRGLEYNSWHEYLTPAHNAALPFTRLLAGHADYTPVTFWNDKCGNTSFAHQLAMAFVLTSPLTHWADHPSRYLSSPALDVIKAAPTVWDETTVLPPSEVGDLVLMARRKGDRWFLAAVNGNATAARSLAVSLTFLGPWRTYDAVQLFDSTGTPFTLNRATSVVRGNDSLDLWLRPGGGFVGMFTAQQTSVAPDFDDDGDVDQADFGHLQACITGQFSAPPTSDCTDADFDQDHDVDDVDLAILQNCLSGPNAPVDPQCAY